MNKEYCFVPYSDEHGYLLQANVICDAYIVQEV